MKHVIAPITFGLMFSILSFGLMACGEEETLADSDTGICELITTEEGLACNGQLRETTPGKALHVSPDEELLTVCNPPAYGNHFAVWSVWGESASPIDRGYWIHNLEHGGIGLLYRCDEGCDETIDGLRAIMDDAPLDLSCKAPTTHRIFLTSDPLLPRSPMVAAVAWGVQYTADCLDIETLETFVETHYGDGPESLCAQGSYSSDMAAAEQSANEL